jgi:hypothetical protein
MIDGPTHVTHLTEHVVAVLEKPFTPMQLLQTLKTSLLPKRTTNGRAT